MAPLFDSSESLVNKIPVAEPSDFNLMGLMFVKVFVPLKVLSTDDEMFPLPPPKLLWVWSVAISLLDKNEELKRPLNLSEAW